MSNPNLELVSHRLCPFVQRAVILLLEKDIPHQITYIDLANKPDWFLQTSPLGKVPLLKVEGEVLFESAVICEYLDEITPGSLHPLGPLEKAKHRAWIEFGSGIFAEMYAFFNVPIEEAFEQKRRMLVDKFSWVEQSLTTTPYFGGTSFSMVDATYAPMFRYFDAIEQIADFGFFTDTPKVRAWRQALSDRSSVQRIFAEDYSQQLLMLLKQRHSYLSMLAQKSD
ncbi:glutathione S-transferase family protein [Phormidesmis priestleyi]